MINKILFFLVLLGLLYFVYNFVYLKDVKIDKKSRNRLKNLKKIMKTIILNLKKLYPKHQGIQNVPVDIEIKALPKSSPYKVGYSLNKQTIYLCLDDTKDQNELYFVLLHEFAHFITKSIGHSKEYWNNFKLILRTAIKLNIYKYTNYKYNPKMYCNKLIDHTPI
tara:strand:+ start:614 stop:1108 length:495 start_codon:yes stop_codon:yes gene_type:complete